MSTEITLSDVAPLALGSAVLVVSRHFVSFFLGLETLSVSLYVLIAYTRENEWSLEAGLKYLILAAVSAALVPLGLAAAVVVARGRRSGSGFELARRLLTAQAAVYIALEVTERMVARADATALLAEAAE